MRDQRARDRDALLLAAGELRRMMAGAMREADAIERFFRALVPLRGRHLRVDERQLDVLGGRGARQQVEVLEHEADELVAHARQLDAR